MDIKEFIDEWNNGSDRMLVHTSGSTGKPKPMWVEKKRMAHSARTTCAFLGLKRGDTALLCLSLNYIAGKMMAVRAIEWGLNLVCVEPSGHPLSTINVERLTINEACSSETINVERLTINEACSSETFNVERLTINEACSSEPPPRGRQEGALTFAAMTPMQVYNTLQVAEERERLMQIKHLIIGGGAIDEALEAELRHFPNAVWSTYGMTETLSHIALRRINSPSPTTLLRSEGVKECRSVDNSILRSSGVQEFRSSDNTLASNPSSQDPHPSSNFRSEGVKECRSSDDTQASNPSSPNPHPSSIPPSFGGDGGGYYTPFPDVSVSLNGEGCLVIDAPGVCAQRLVTNDCAELHPDGRRFRIIGRKDNVINSGGIKIHAEEVEQMLRPHLSMPFIITKATDPKFGEVVALVYEEGLSCGQSIQSICQSVLPKYWQPRRYLPVEQILITETGKPRRDISLYSN